MSIKTTFVAVTVNADEHHTINDELFVIPVNSCETCLVCATGYDASAAGSATWLPGVPLWLPLCFLWRHSAQLHTSAQPRPQCIPSQHATSRSVHAEPEGWYAARNHACAPRDVKFCQLHSATVVQEGQLPYIFLLLSLFTSMYLKLQGVSDFLIEVFLYSFNVVGFWSHWDVCVVYVSCCLWCWCRRLTRTWRQELL